MNRTAISQTSAIVTAVCAAAFLLLAVFTAMQHEKGWITASCAGAALASLLVTNIQLRILHKRKEKDAESQPPA